MKLIFLDINGVLNNARTVNTVPSGCIGIGDSLLKRLAKIVHLTGAKIILSSSWMHDWSIDPCKCSEDALYLNDVFWKNKIFIADKIDDSELGRFHKGYAIQQYINKHPKTESFVIFDDHSFDFEKVNLSKRLVLTDPAKGLTNANVEDAIRILTEA